MTPVITRTTPIYTVQASMGVFVQWEVQDPPAGDLTFTLERSESTTGPWETVQSGITAAHWYDPHETVDEVDSEARNFLSLARTTYYRVRAEGPGTAPVLSEPRIVGDMLERRQYLLRRKIQRDIRISFKFNTVPFAILKRRHWGVRCTNCFDKLTKQTTQSQCKVCFSTGFVGGYHPPVYVSARKGVTNIATSTAPQGKSEVNQVELTLLDYPQVEVGDLICEYRMNRRYLVRHATRTELRGVPVHQRLIMAELARDGVENRILISAPQSPTFY